MEAHLAANGTHGIFTLPSLPPISPDATTEELIAHAEELSAQMALQSYYMPILGGVQDFIKNEAGGIMDRVTADGNANGNGSSIHFSGQFGYLEGGDVGEGFAGLDDFRRGLSGGGRDDEDDRDGDYVDHLPQRGNTKKRKSPPTYLAHLVAPIPLMDNLAVKKMAPPTAVYLSGRTRIPILLMV